MYQCLDMLAMNFPIAFMKAQVLQINLSIYKGVFPASVEVFAGERDAFPAVGKATYILKQYGSNHLNFCYVWSPQDDRIKIL